MTGPPDAIFSLAAFARGSHGVMVAAMLVVMFSYGLIEALVLGRKQWACITWTTAVVTLAVWIGYAASLGRVMAGMAAFAAGMILIIKYYRRRGA